MIADYYYYYYYYYYSSHHYFGLRGVLEVARGGDVDCVGVLLFPLLDTEGIEYAIGRWYRWYRQYQPLLSPTPILRF